MLRDRYARRRAITFIVLIALCLVMLAVSGSAPVRELRRGVNFAVSPVQGSLSDGTKSVTDVLGAFGEISTLRRENQDLLDQLTRLQDEIAALDSVREENRRLARQLKTRNRLDHETVVGQVTNRQSTQFERVITLDIGTESGVAEDFAVLSEGGALVGKVIEVGDGWSSVQLINDTRSLVIGLDSRTRATGEVTGRLSSPLAMAEIPITDKISVNDRIVTAGTSIGKRFRSLFPKGLPIGRVVDVQSQPGSIVQTALVEATADLERLEDVLVITSFKPPRRSGGEPSE
jgi:rod shape-determining protein MreC